MSAIRVNPAPELQAILRDAFEYRDGAFYWVNPKLKSIKAGERAGCLKKDKRGDYRQVCVNGVRHLEHRAVFAYLYGWYPDELDHIDGDGTNNRIDNLRPCSRAENCRNRKSFRGGTSKYKGVSRSKGKWRAVINANKRRYHLGYFDTQEQAHKAYCEAAKELHGEFVNTGAEQ